MYHLKVTSRWAYQPTHDFILGILVRMFNHGTPLVSEVSVNASGRVQSFRCGTNRSRLVIPWYESILYSRIWWSGHGGIALKHMKSQPIAYPQVNVSLEAMTYAAKSCKLANNLWYNSRYWTQIPMYQFQVSPNINFADASVKSLLLHGVVMVAGCPRPATCCSAPSARIFKASSPLLLGTDREPP